MQNYLAQVGQWVTVIQGVIFVLCVLLFRRGIDRRAGGAAAHQAVRRATNSASTSLITTLERRIAMSAEARLKELGLMLPSVPAAVANYLPYRIAGNLLFLAGQGPRDETAVHDRQGRRRGFGRGRLQARPHRRACSFSSAMKDGARLARPRRYRREDALHGQRRAGLQGLIPRSPTACPTCSSRCSARTAGTPARRSAWARCRTRSRSRSRASSPSKADRAFAPHDASRCCARSARQREVLHRVIHNRRRAPRFRAHFVCSPHART